LAGLVIVLGFAAGRTFQKGIGLCKAEREAAKDEKAGEELKPGDKENEDSDPEEREDAKEDKVYNWAWFTGKSIGVPFWTKKVAFLLFANWVVLSLFNVLVGTTALGVKCGTPVYWGTLSVTFPVFFLITLGMAWILKKKYDKRAGNGFEYTAADIKWTPKRIAVFCGSSLCTGILAAMFGLGGGTLNSPLLLELGVLPAQIPATSGLMILITSSVAIIQYLALGRISWDYLMWFVAVGFIGGVSGHLGIRYYIKKYKKQSTIVLLLGCLVFAGLVVLVYTLATLFVNKTAVMSLADPCAK
jgi:uncharacterized membrane protein YfcA